jgi:hypothetical protein
MGSGFRGSEVQKFKDTGYELRGKKGMEQRALRIEKVEEFGIRPPAHRGPGPMPRWEVGKRKFSNFRFPFPIPNICPLSIVIHDSSFDARCWNLDAYSPPLEDSGFISFMLDQAGHFSARRLG